MGVATNDATATAVEALAALGIDDYLPHVFGYDSVPHPKPAPDIVLAFAAATGLSTRATSPWSATTATTWRWRAPPGAGIAIGVLSGNSSDGRPAAHADIVLPSIRELPAWLAGRRPPLGPARDDDPDDGDGDGDGGDGGE